MTVLFKINNTKVTNPGNHIPLKTIFFDKFSEFLSLIHNFTLADNKKGFLNFCGFW
jgi:hypothetical protein